jgi:hypothetical protein
MAPPPTMKGNFFSKCNSFFLKFQAKNKFKKLGNTKNLLNEKASYAGIQTRLKFLMIETQKPKKYNSCQRKGWLPHLQQKFSPQAHC